MSQTLIAEAVEARSDRRQAEMEAALADMRELELPVDDDVPLRDIVVDENAPMFCTWKIGE